MRDEDHWKENETTETPGRSEFKDIGGGRWERRERRMRRRRKRRDVKKTSLVR
jgi:hypothetical protein